MKSIIFNSILTVIVLIACVVAYLFDELNLVGFILTLVPLIASVVFSIYQETEVRNRERKLRALGEIRSLCNYCDAVVKDSIRVNLANERSRKFPQIDISKQIIKIRENHAPMLLAFAKTFNFKQKSKEYNCVFNGSMEDLRNLVKNIELKLKPNEIEMSFLYKTKQK